MAITVNDKDLGMVTAYAYALAGGYTGTEAEFEALLGKIAEDLAEIENLSVQVQTLPAGSDATASYAEGVLTLGIPRGNKGETGDQGEIGPTPQLSVGTVTTGEPGTDAEVEITGTPEAPVLNFTIPRGDTGNITQAVRYDAAQTLTDAEKEQARANIDAADAREVADLKSAIETISSGDKIDIISKATITGAVLLDGTNNSASQYVRSDYIPIQKGQYIECVAMQLSTAAAILSFYDEAKTCIVSSSVAGLGSTINAYARVTVAQNGYIRISTKAETISNAHCYLYSVQAQNTDEIGALKNAVEKTGLYLVEPKTYKKNNEILFTSADINAGDRIYYSITSTPTAAYIVLYDSNGNKLRTLGSSSSTESGRSDEGVLIIPTGFSYAQIETNNDSAALTINYILADESILSIVNANRENIAKYDDLLTGINEKWYVGKYNPANGGVSSEGNQIRTLEISNDIVVIKSNSMLLSVYAYRLTDDTYVGTWNGKSYKKSDINERWMKRIDISFLKRNDNNANYYKICAKKDDESSVTIDDGESVNLLVFTDTSLAKSNKVADSKAVGDSFKDTIQSIIKAGLYVAPAKEYKTQDELIFDTNTVKAGDTLYYKIKSTPTAAYIWMYNSDDERIASIGSSSSGQTERIYEGTITIPSGFSYALVKMTNGGVLTVDYLYTQNSIPMLVKPSGMNIESLNLASACAVESAIVKPFSHPYYNKIYPQILVTTDIHSDWTRLLRAFSYYDTNDNLALALCLGDQANMPADFDSFNWENVVLNCKNAVLPIIGNHDATYLTNQTKTHYTDEELFSYFFSSDLRMHNGETHNGSSLYWYKDITKTYTDGDGSHTKKLRIIGLNQYELGEYTENRDKIFYTQNQIDWLIDLLDNTDANTYVLIAVHVTPTTTNTIQESIMTPTGLAGRSISGGSAFKYQGNPEMLVKIIDAWQKSINVTLTNVQTGRTSVEASDTIDVNHTFAGDISDKHFVGWICGHQHFDAYAIADNYPDQKIITLNCTSAREDLQNGDLGRKLEGKSQDCITLLSYDWDNDKIRIVRLGADYTHDGRQRVYAVI